MPISSVYHNECCVLRLDGPLTIYEAMQSKQRLLDELHLAGALELDLSGVAEFDTAGMQLLLLIKREAARLQKPLAFLGHSKAVLTVIDLYNMGGVFGDPVVIASGDRP